MKAPITGEDYARAAERLGCDPCAIEAVASVESAGSGFNPDDSPKTLFEGHVFHRLTQGRFDASSQTLSYPKWTREHYGRTWQDEAYRLSMAMALDPVAAMQATSWGRFQLMGFNYDACGFPDVQTFVAAMKESERWQLDAFVSYIISRNLADELRDQRWADLARAYNGPGFAANHYDERMEKAFHACRHAKGLE